MLFVGVGPLLVVRQAKFAGVPQTRELPHLMCVSIVANGSSFMAELIHRLSLVSITAVRSLSTPKTQCSVT